MKEILLETNQSKQVWAKKPVTLSQGNEYLPAAECLWSLTNCVSTDKAFYILWHILTTQTLYGKGKKVSN